MKKNIEIEINEIKECDICCTSVTAHYVVIYKISRIFGANIEYILCYNCYERIKKFL